MASAHERLVNLALFLASRSRPVSIEECRAAGLGYPQDADDAAFQRMFERDKDALRASGLAIVAHEDGRYSLDPRRSFASEVELSDAEKQAFARATRPVFDKWAGQIGAELVRKAEAAIRALT